jgi:beta-galactosidase
LKTLAKPILGAVYMVEENLSLERHYHDLEQIKKKGLHVIVMWPPVSPWDSEDGVSFSFKTVDKIMDKCHELGLQVIVELEGQNPAFQFAPDYLFKPEHSTVSDRARHWVNYYHPEVIEHMATYIRLVANHFKNHPALYGYDVFNEVNFHSTDVYTVNAFRKWLENKYGTTAKLNKIWKRFFTSFDQVHLTNLRINYSRWSSLRPWLDFEDFRADSIRDFVKTWGDLIREIDPKHPIIADNSWSMTTFDTTTLGNDDWKVASVVDSFGLSVYPQSWDVRLREDPCSVAQIYRGGISAGKESQKKPIMISELQTHNQTALAKGSSVFDEIRIWTWQAFAHGAEGLIYWKWNPFTTGFQVGGRGMTSADGTPNERADQAAECANVLTKHGDYFLGREVYNHHVYLVYNPVCDRFTDIILPDDHGLYRKSIKAWYQYLWEKGIQPTFVKPEDIPSIKNHSKAILIAPLLSMVSNKETVAIKEFIGKGGKLIADGRFAIVDENGFAFEQAPGDLMETLGFKEMDFISPYEDQDFSFERFSRVTLKNGKAELVSAKGDPVIVSTEKTLYFASPVGVDLANAQIKKKLDEYFDKNLSHEIEVKQKTNQVDLVISKGKGTMISVINYGKQPETVIVKLDVSGKINSFWPRTKAQINGNTVTFIVPARDVGTIVIE